MNVQWHDARVGRPAFYADVAGRRVFVEQTVRSHRAHGIVGTEFQASIAGVRLGEFPSLELARTFAVYAAQTKQKRPRRTSPRGHD